MTNLLTVSAQPWVERLGVTLLHFLWQGVLIALIYAAIRHCLTRVATPHVNYLLACAALSIMGLAPVLTFTLLAPLPLSPASAAAAIAVPPVWSAGPAAAQLSPALVSSISHTAPPLSFLQCVVAFWLIGAMALSLRVIGGWILAERLRLKLNRPAPHCWQQALDRLKIRLRVSRPVRLLVSSLVQAPAVVGWLRPVVLVPVGALAGLPPDQIEALLLHELAHIRRYDYLINVLQRVVEALLFYHPAVWWVSDHIRVERELCCDDLVISADADVLSYARALAELESTRSLHATAALAANGGSLSRRIARLSGHSYPRRVTYPLSALAANAILLSILAFALFAQQPAPQPKFEVASIKPSDVQGFMIVRPLRDRLTADASVRMFIENAYTVQSFQILGGPDWINSDHYAINATTGVPTGHAQLFLMLRSLLEDRFQLKIHHETKMLPVYALVPAKTGLKLPAPREGSCVSPEPQAFPEWGGGRLAPPSQDQLPASRCGSIGVMLQLPGAHMQGGKIPMTEFVRSLSMVLDRAVVDNTGFTGLFDLRLDFLPDETTSVIPPPPPESEEARNPTIPTIHTALQQQLGLRLESSKAPVDVLVIDHIEKPSPN